MNLSKNAAQMQQNPPSAEPRVVSGVAPTVNMREREWREANAGRSLERDRLSPGTRASH
jgi:hypothetical protein